MGILERGFAAMYDRFMGAAERTWLGRARDELLSPLEGRVLEIGGGTGANLPHYPHGLRVVVAEPSAPMREHLLHKLVGQDVYVEVSDAGAEHLPFADDSFDAVVATLVLCTVPDVDRALAEVRRVLAPDGRFYFLEHGGGSAGRRGTWQHRLEPVWRTLACGCHLTRDARANVEAAGFEILELEEWEPPRTPPVMRPFVRGVAA